MNNPIKDNRIVSNITFATRFLSFVEDIDVNDACSEDEKEAMVKTAERLLKYQVRTATDADEIDYLKRIGVYDKYPEQKLVTEDGYTLSLEEKDCDITIYSCMKKPPTGDQVLQIHLSKIINSNHKVRKDRVYFVCEDKCKTYMELNRPKYSIKEVEYMLEKTQQKEHIINIMKGDEELGLYDED